MKTYKSIEETIADVRKKDKRYNYIVLIITLIMVVAIASIIIVNYENKSQLQKATIAENEIIIAELETERITTRKLREQDSIRTDSISELVVKLRQELSDINKQLARGNTTGSDRQMVLANINLAQDQLNKIANNISDHTIVRYYKRRADSDKIEEVIQSMKDPSFRLNLKSVPNDNGRYKVNTIWYGSDVNKNEVYKLVRRLTEIGVKIRNVKPFENPATKDWKSEAIELGYEASSTTTQLTKSEVTKLRVNNNNIKYNVRLYSYKADRKVKAKLATLIKKENYTVNVYPEWKEKHSFFANVPTIFYYDKETKDIAEKLAATLNQNVGVRFKVQLGSGYGIGKSEKKNTFIIHYTQ